MDILLHRDPYAADHLIVDRDPAMSRRVLTCDLSDPIVGIRPCIRVRESVA
jgi:hypothetical protein